MDLPTTLNIDDKSDSLSVDSDGLRVVHTGPHGKQHALIRANNPIPSQCKLFYFEVDIIDKGENGIIGAGFCTKMLHLHDFPGWRKNSWGYHGDDGKFFCNSGYGKLYGPLFTTGDTIGCCFNFMNNMVFFTKNGVHLGIAKAYENEKNENLEEDSRETLNKELKGTLYPCVGLASQDGSVEVNFGHKKFKYMVMTDDDIDEELKKEWINLNFCNDKLISQQIDKIAVLKKSLEITQTLRYQGKLYYIIGNNKQALECLTELLKLKPNDLFALRYRSEIHYVEKRYKESSRDLNRLSEIDKTNFVSFAEEVTRKKEEEKMEKQIKKQIVEFFNEDLDQRIRLFRENIFRQERLRDLRETDREILDKYQKNRKIMCRECEKEYIFKSNEWCRSCNSQHFKDNFGKWTSGSEDLDDFLKDNQSNAKSPDKVMEWIPYEDLYGEEKIAEGGFGIVYRSVWMDGPIGSWDINNKEWKRNKYHPIAMKILKDSDTLDSDALLFNSLTEVKRYIEIDDNTLFIRVLGFSKVPKSKKYIMVMEYAEHSLQDYLTEHNNCMHMTWENRMKALLDVSIGLEHLHNSKLTHRDLHPGNLLFNNQEYLLITDLGQCKSILCDENENCGTRYTAPEIRLKKKPYDYQAADVFSFGMIMYFVATGKTPFENIDKCGFNFEVRNPKIDEQSCAVPKYYVKLMEKCWNSDPKERPKISSIKRDIRSIMSPSSSKFIEDAEKRRKELIKNSSSTTIVETEYDQENTCVLP